MRHLSVIYLYQNCGLYLRAACINYFSYYLRLVFEGGFYSRKYGMKRSIYHNVFDRRVNNPGRPKRLTERHERNIIRAVHRLRISIGFFTAKRLRFEAGIPATTSMWTIRRVLNRHGYRYLQSRRKDILTRKNAYKRLEFARRMKRLSSSFWKHCISFYFDGKSFVHETILMTKSEQGNHSHGEQGMKG